jgi:broad specificity phosphatase PhoE
MVTFLIVRHGFSASNVQATFTGQLDAPLIEKGFLQAEVVSKYIYDNYKVDAIYSSDLSRAVDTITPLSKACNLPIIKDKDLREIYGGKWEGVETKDLIERYGEVYEKWQRHDPSVRTDGGESMQELQARAIGALKRIAKGRDGQTVVVTTHGGVIKVLAGAFLNLPMSEWKEKIPYVANASITVTEYDGEKFVQRAVLDEYLGDLKTEMPKGI